MKYKILQPTNFESINWSGGTSTQLYIHPPTANYQKRNFDFRISTAKVETEKSDFTPLPGVTRHLMILNGSIHISHKNQHKKQMNPFDQDLFMGDWETSSLGKCIDFNLMTRNNCKGELSAIHMQEKEQFEWIEKEKINHLFLFIQSGEFEVKMNSETENIKAGSLLHIKSEQKIEFPVSCLEVGSIICSRISLPVTQ